MLSSILYTIYFFVSLSNGIILYDTAIVDNTQNITITIKIDTCTDTANIITTGSSIPIPFGISFNPQSTYHPYSIFVSNTNKHTNAYEYKSNISLPSMISLTNNVQPTSNTNLKTIILSRNRIGMSSDHYTFPNTTSSFKISWIFAGKSLDVEGSKFLTLKIEKPLLDNCEAMSSIQSNQCSVRGTICSYDSDCCDNMKCNGNKCDNINQIDRNKSRSYKKYNKFKTKQFWLYWGYHISYWGSYYLVLFSIVQHVMCTIVMVYYIWIKRGRRVR